MAKTKRAKPGIPDAIRRRLAAVRNVMSKRRLDGLLITSRTDQFYLTGFNGEDGMVLISSRQVYLLSDFRFAEAACRDAPWARFVMRRKSHADELAKIARRGRLARIGFVADRISVAQFAALRKALRPTGARFVRVPGATADLRVRKDATELAAIREAIQIAEASFRAIRRWIRIGHTEAELAARLNYEMGRRGASGQSFPTIVAEGPNSALPHAEPGRRKIKRGSAVLFDWGARYGGYCSDLTRVLFVGRIPPRFRRLYEIVLEAQQRGIRAVRAGQTVRTVDDAARSYIAKCGYGNKFGHALGHGLGLDVHEPPSLSARSPASLEPGTIVTIEPGIYVPGLGGVRIEDDVCVTDDGCEVLSTLPSDLGWAVIDR